MYILALMSPDLTWHNLCCAPSNRSKAVLGDTIFLPVAGMVMDENGKVFNLQQKSLATALGMSLVCAITLTVAPFWM